MNCENCRKEHSGEYGSGRFCSCKCARGFSSKEKREEINRKVSLKLKGHLPWCMGKKVEGKRIFDCLNCNLRVKRKSGSKTEFCSTNCRKEYIRKQPGFIEKRGGLREKGGLVKEYFVYINKFGNKMTLNKFELKVAEKLDELDIFWKRNTAGFEYTTLDGKIRKYYPDFYTDLGFIEYKGWVNETMLHKMKECNDKHKLNLLIVYSTDKRYENLGTNLEEFLSSADISHFFNMA